jgi:hypothetical protein
MMTKKFTLDGLIAEDRPVTSAPRITCRPMAKLRTSPFHMAEKRFGEKKEKKNI